jgi:hypothetical protein
MGAPRVWQKVMAVLVDAPGVTLYRTEIAERAGLTPEQVYGAINTIMRNSEKAPFIDVVHKGAAWRYAPKGATLTQDSIKQRAQVQGTVSRSNTGPSPSPLPSLGTSTRVFEEIGKLKDGSILLRDSDGNMWSASEL